MAPEAVETLRNFERSKTTVQKWTVLHYMISQVEKRLLNTNQHLKNNFNKATGLKCLNTAD